MELILKLKHAEHLDEEGKEAERELIEAVNNGKAHDVKLTTNQLHIERDKRDDRYIKTLKRIKMVFKLKKGGCLILIGNLGCNFNRPFGGEFYVTSAVTEEKNFNDVEGVKVSVRFDNYPTSPEYMFMYLAEIAADKDFVYDLSQFEEFMDLFTFYKELSAELNNNVTYSILHISEPFHFVSVDEKTIQTDDANAIVNQSGIVVGYKLEDYIYERLSDEMKDRVSKLVDIRLEKADIKKIAKFSQDLYLSNQPDVTDANSKQLCSLDLVNIAQDGSNVVLSGEIKNVGKYSYLHLYDMGQKIKIESINNSLKLIKQGETGSAAELLQYIIGSKPMPTKTVKRKRNDGKDKYIEGLDESQKQAFLMATDLSPVSLIKGPPGTGKTHVINAIVQYITKELGEKVVISSQTHVAIDNVLDKLMENYDLIIPNRITNRRNRYSGSEIDGTLYKTWAKKFDEHNARSRDGALARKIAEDMKKFKGENKFRFSESVDISDYSVIGATTTTSAIGGKRGLEVFDGYDWLIIDEVSKCPITEVLRYLPYVSRIIMVGDDCQLAPLLEFSLEEVKKLKSFDADKFEKLKEIYEKSVFTKTLDKARKAGRLVTLNVNYRSVRSVLNTYNIFYDNILDNRRERIKPQKVQFKKDVFNNKDVFFVDVKYGKEAEDANTKSRYNVEELAATKDILIDLIENTEDASNVSVAAIFPYSAQIGKFQQQNVDLINKAKRVFKSFEIDTVDAFQGREADIVLVNTVVTDASRGNFLKEFRRINVSMSRARDKLFIFGNPQTLSRIQMQLPDGAKRNFFKDIIGDIMRYGQVIEYNGGIRYESANKPKIEVD